jgi:ATP-dependent DNA helicase RecG
MASRADSDFLLDCSVGKVRAVSANRAKLLAKMDIHTVRDLLNNYPRRYIDLSKTSTAAQAPIGEFVTVVGVVDEIKEKQPRKRLHILEVSIFDGTGIIVATWFRQPWVTARFSKGMRVAFSGKVTFEYGFKRMNSPHIAFLGEPGEAEHPLDQMVAVHSTTEGVSTTWMRRFIANALEQTADITDTLPADLRVKYGLVSKKAALRQIHFPGTPSHMKAARRRLAYEEVLQLQLEMMRRRRMETCDGMPTVHTPGPYTRALSEQLPYTLTDEQKRAVADITRDMTASAAMNRMLLGDVGTGKTAVAAFALAICADSGCQAAMMAPTEVLARQYAEKMGPLFDAIGMEWGILTGSTRLEERKRLLDAVADGSMPVLFGTHALIEPSVRFAHLSLVIIDEQHRFGVNQRAALRMKGPGCDLLVMTATPIPRTLALTLYGDLETSYIRTRPGNTIPTVSRIVSRDARGHAYEAIKAALAEGRKAYIICPLVGLSREKRAEQAENGMLYASLAGGGDISDPKAAEDEAARLQRDVFSGYRVGLLTGRMNAGDKQRVMEEFRDGSIDVLVATTVVEVGVDVPDATVMMIEDAERFGLSQLHQLRGRVGRGKYPGTVFLVADPGKDDTELQARMDAFVSTTDGFELAEADLKARREGDVMGNRQHGAETLRLVNVIDDAELITCAHEDAIEIFKSDPELSAPDHEPLAREIARVFATYDEVASKGA